MAQSILFTPASELPREEYLVKESLKNAFTYQTKAEDIQKEIDKSIAELEKELAPLRDDIKSLLEARDRIIEDHLLSDVKQEGAFFVEEYAKPRQVIDADLFAEKYPEEFDILVRKHAARKFKPTKDDAAFVLTSYQIEKICKPQGTSKYRVGWDIRTGMPEKAGTVEP